MKAELENIKSGVFMHITFKDGELEKKVSLGFNLIKDDQYELRLSRETIEDLTNLINRMGKK